MSRGAAVLAHHHLLELLPRAQVGVGGQVDLDQLALGLAHRRQIVVVGEGLPDLHRADVERGHPVGLQPDAHGEGARPEDVRPLHDFQGSQPRLDRADQVVGDLVLLQELRGEAQVGRGELAVGGLDVEDWDLRLRRKIAADLVDLRSDLRERFGGVVIEPQAGPDGGEAQLALRLDVVDAVGGGDDPLERGGDEAAHQVGGRADVHGGDGDHRVLVARILADVERADRLHARDHDQEVDHQGDHRPPDEQIGELHGVLTCPRASAPPRRSEPDRSSPRR